MKSNKRQQRKQRIAAVIAIVLVIAMVLSLLTPIFTANAAETATVETEDENILSEKEKKNQQEEIGLEKFDVDVKIGFEQQYIVENTTPFWITIRNQENAFKGEVQIKIVSAYVGDRNDGDTIYSLYYQPLELEKNASKQMYFTIPLESIQNSFEISFLEENGNVVYRKYVQAKALDPDTILVGVISQRAENLNYLSGLYFAQAQNTTEDITKIVFLQEENFPKEKIILENFDMIVIDDFDTNLFSKEQKEALLQWVKDGGNVILGTGIHAQKVLNGLQEQFPIIENGTERKRIEIASQSVVADVANISGENVTPYMTDKNTVLMSAMKLGEGNVMIYHIALSLAPATELYGFVNYMQQGCEMVSPLLLEVYPQEYDYSRNGMNYVAGKFPQLKTNSLYMILFSILLYIILIGPVAYILLKKKDKRELGWIVIPAISLCFVVIVFLFSMNSQYKSGIVNVVSSTDLLSEEGTGTTNIVGYAKSSKKGDIVLGAEEFMNLAVPADSVWNHNHKESDSFSHKVLTADKTEITYFNKASWEDNMFTLKTKTNLGGTIDVDITIEGNELVGNIINQTTRDLKDIIVVADQKIFYIDGLKSKESCEIKQDISTKENAALYEQLNQAFGDLDNRKAVLEKIQKEEVSKQDVYRMMREKSMIENNIDFDKTVSDLEQAKEIVVDVYAFDESSILPAALQINGEEAIENNLNLYHVEHKIDVSKSNTFELPFGMIDAVPMLGKEDTSRIHSGGFLYVQNMGEIEWDFVLPENTTIESFQVRSMNPTEYFYAPPQIYNIQTDTWELLRSDIYTDILPYISTTEENKVIRVKYFVTQETDVNNPQIKMKGVGNDVGSETPF